MMTARKIKHTIIPVVLLAIVLVCFFFSVAWAKTPQQRITLSTQLLQEMSKQSDVEGLIDLLGDCVGVAIFPNVTKAGFVFGAEFGEGLLLRREPNTTRWYGPSFLSIGGVSLGLQIGVQSTGMILVIMDEAGLNALKKEHVNLGADVSVAAGPVGRRAGAATNSIYSYSLAKGAFAGVSLGGGTVDIDENANIAYWGKNLTPEEILQKRATRSDVQPLVKELNSLIAMAKKNKS